MNTEFNEWWNEDLLTADNPFVDGTPAYWAWEGWCAAVKSERDLIAQMIEDSPPLVELARNEHGGCLMCGFTPKLAAAAIRARNGT